MALKASTSSNSSMVIRPMPFKRGVKSLHDELCEYVQELNEASEDLTRETLGDLHDEFQAAVKEFEVLTYKCPTLERNNQKPAVYWEDIRYQFRGKLSIIQAIAAELMECSDGFPADQIAALKVAIQLCREVLPLVNLLQDDEDLVRPILSSMREGQDWMLDEGFKLCVALFNENEELRKVVENFGKNKVNIVDMNDDRFASQDGYASCDLIFITLKGAVSTQMKFLDIVMAYKREVVVCVSEEDMVHAADYFGAGASSVITPKLFDKVANQVLERAYDYRRVQWREYSLQRALNGVREVFSTTIESLREGFVLYDAKGRAMLCNTVFRRYYPTTRSFGGTGFSYENLLRANMKHDVYHIQGDEEAWFDAQMEAHNTLVPSVIELSDGRWIHVREQRTADGGTVSLHKDITAQRQDTEKLTYLAYNDPLTDIANRVFFEKQAARLLKEAKENETKCILLYMDVNGFKQINDVHGHLLGDQVLIHIARQLERSIRSTDIIARFGGDEFIVMLSEVGATDVVSLLVERFHKGFEKFSEKEFDISVSIGAAVYPDDADDYSSLLVKADEAMYESKRTRAPYVVYS